MTLSAESDPALRRRLRRTDDGEIVEPGRDGLLVQRTRSMAALAADRPILRLRPRPVEDGPGIGGVAEETILDTVRLVERLTEPMESALSFGGVPGRPDPAGPGVREPQDIGMPAIIPTDERDVTIGRAECI